MEIPPIPEPLRAEARIRDLPDELIDAEWAKHVAWCSDKGKDSGGRIWSDWVKRTVADLKERRSTDEIAEETRKRREAEALRRKEESEREYRKGALTLPQWLDYLIGERARGATLFEHEYRLLKAGPPPDDAELLGVWLVDALDPRRRRSPLTVV